MGNLSPIQKPACPNCGFAFRFFSHPTWTCWNPYEFTCPRCGAILHNRNADRALVSSFLLGMVIAGIVIACEKAEIWKESSSLTFLTIAFLMLILPWSAFWWRRSKWIALPMDHRHVLTSGKRRLLLVTNLGLVIGSIVIGWFFRSLPLHSVDREFEQKRRTKIEASEDIKWLRETLLATDKCTVSFQELAWSVRGLLIFCGVAGLVAGAINFGVIFRCKRF